VLISVEKYPRIIEAMNCVVDETTNVGSGNIPVREVPDRWGGYLENIEETFAKLSKTERAQESPDLPAHVKPDEFMDSEFYAFCNGEFHEQSAIANRSLEFTQAYVFLSDFFEDWTLTGDGVKDEPGNVVLQNRVAWLDTVAQESAVGLTPEQETELYELRGRIR
jgi:hypothetical protein